MAADLSNMPALVSIARARVAIVCAAALVCATAPRATSARQDTSILLDRAAAYVETFVERFSNVVAEERYTQERVFPGPKTRTLVSDYFLINLPGSKDWLELRDVVEIDGKPVGDHENRLLALVTSGTPATWTARARAVARESARYNIEDIGTINRPIIAMALLQVPYRERLVFTLGPIDKKIGSDARLIRYQETKPPSMFSVGFVTALAWVSESTGVVLKTELQFGNNTSVTNHVVTTFAPDATLGVSVPVTMEDAYAFDGAGGFTEIRGRATYGRFRKFGVKTEEKIQ